MRHPAALLLAATLLASAANAGEVGGIKLADTKAVAGSDLVLNGAGVRTKVVFKVYVAALYVPAKATNLSGVLAKGPRRLELHMLRGLDAKTLVEALEAGLTENNTAAELTAIKAQHDKLVATMNAMPALKENDVVSFDFADDATGLALNGKALGSFAGGAFNAALLKIWLGSKPVQDDLKKQLLGG